MRQKWSKRPKCWSERKKKVKNYSAFFFVFYHSCSMWMRSLCASTWIEMNGFGRRLSFASGYLFLVRPRASFPGAPGFISLSFWQIKNLLNRKCEIYEYFFCFRLLLFSWRRGHRAISKREMQKETRIGSSESAQKNVRWTSSTYSLHCSVLTALLLISSSHQFIRFTSSSSGVATHSTCGIGSCAKSQNTSVITVSDRRTKLSVEQLSNDL